jgi:hypothetical protein
MKENEVGGHVACKGEGRNVYRVLVGNPKEEDHLKDHGIDGINMKLGEIGWGGGGVDSPGPG